MNLLMKYLVDRDMRPHWWFTKGDPCPYCGETCCDQSEYVDVGVGMVPVTYDHECWNCGARGVNVGTEVRWHTEEEMHEANHGVSGQAFFEDEATEEEVAGSREGQPSLPVPLSSLDFDL